MSRWSSRVEGLQAKLRAAGSRHGGVNHLLHAIPDNQRVAGGMYVTPSKGGLEVHTGSIARRGAFQLGEL